MRLRSAVFAISGLALAAGLAACSGEPSEADMKAAVENSASWKAGVDVAKTMARLSGQGAATNPKISKLQKIACKSGTEQPGYWCDFEITVNGAVTPAKGRFVAAADGWRFAEQ